MSFSLSPLWFVLLLCTMVHTVHVQSNNKCGVHQYKQFKLNLKQLNNFLYYFLYTLHTEAKTKTGGVFFFGLRIPSMTKTGPHHLASTLFNANN